MDIKIIYTYNYIYNTHLNSTLHDHVCGAHQAHQISAQTETCKSVHGTLMKSLTWKGFGHNFKSLLDREL